MPQDAKCPRCGHTFPVTEARHPFTVACPRCEAELTVEFKKPATPPEAGEPPYQLAVRPGALSDAPTAAARPKKRKDEDDEEGKARGGGSALIVLLSGGMGLTVVLLGLALTGWFLFTQVDTEPEVVSRPNNTSNNGGNRNNSGGSRNKSGNVGPNTGNNGNAPGPRFEPPRFTPPRITPPRVEAPPKPVDAFDLRPVAGTLSKITPPADLDAGVPKTILLPGKADAVAVGGGGRYIVFHFPEGRLAVFDVNAADLTKEVATDSGRGALTAGANVVVVGVPNSRNKFRVYSLPDLRQMNEFEVPMPGGVRSIAMGAATNGPLLAVDYVGQVALIDPTSGKAVEGASGRPGIHAAQVRASHDGKLFVAGNGYGRNDKFSVLSESLRKWEVKSPDILAAYPAADGRRIYGKDQIITPSGNSVAGSPAGLQQVWYVPAVTATGDYFLRVSEVKAGSPPRARNAVSVGVHRGSDVDRPVLTAWEGLPETDRLVSGIISNTEPLDRHLFLIPEAKLLVILNKDKTKLVVRKLAI